MRITKNQLKQIIKEELAGVLGEADEQEEEVGVIDEEEVKVFDDPTYKPEPEPKPGKKKKPKDVGNPRYNPPKKKPPMKPMKNKSKSKADK